MITASEAMDNVRKFPARETARNLESIYSDVRAVSNEGGTKAELWVYEENVKTLIAKGFTLTKASANVFAKKPTGKGNLPGDVYEISWPISNPASAG